MAFAKNGNCWVPRRLSVIDDFFRDPYEVRRWALNQEFVEPEDVTGWRSVSGRIFPGVLQKLKKCYGKTVSMLPLEDNDTGVVFLSYRNGTRGEAPCVHWDYPENAYIAVIYLSPNVPPGCGTSLWRHRRTGLERAPVRSDETSVGKTCEDLAEELENDASKPSRWIELDRIGHKFNRAVIYPAYLLHSATNHYGSSKRNGRMYQVVGFRI
jgi:hypothetical protein